MGSASVSIVPRRTDQYCGPLFSAQRMAQAWCEANLGQTAVEAPCSLPPLIRGAKRIPRWEAGIHLLDPDGLLRIHGVNQALREPTPDAVSKRSSGDYRRR